MSITIIPGYILRNALAYFFLAFAILSAVLFMNQFVQVFNSAVVIGAPLDWVFYSMFMLSPAIVSLSAPMASALSTLLSLTDLSEKKEILALRAAGFSVWQIIWPILTKVIALSVFLIILNNWISPYGFHSFKNSQRILTDTLSGINIEPKTFIKIGDWKFIVQSADKNRKTIEGVHLFQQNKLVRISAPKGKYIIAPGKYIELQLFNGSIQLVNKITASKATLARYDKYAVRIPLRKGEISTNRELPEQYTGEILREIKHGALTEKRKREYIIEASLRFALALAPVVLFFLSCPLGLGWGRGKGWAFVLSIAILFGYYGLLAFGMSFAKKMPFLVWAGPWLPNAAGSVAAFIMWKKRGAF